jgi:hypothetical protein
MRCRAAAFAGKMLIAETTVEINHSADTVRIYKIEEAILTEFYDTNSVIILAVDGSIKLEYYLD